MSLLPIERKAIDLVPVALQPYVQAKFQTPIKQYSDYDLEREIKAFILVAFAEMGVSPGGSNATDERGDRVVTFLRETLQRDLRAKKYENLTMAEIRLFVSNGLRGEYGTFKSQLATINIQNIHYWIKKGMESEERTKALKEFSAARDREEMATKPTVTYDDKWWMDRAKIMFATYKDKKLNPHKAIEPFVGNVAPAAVYDVLNKKDGVEIETKAGKFNSLVTDPTIRAAVISAANQEFDKDKAEIKRQALKKGWTFKNNPDSDKATRQAIQKKHLLKAYFDSLIEQNKEI